MRLIQDALVAMVGLSGGLAVGSGFVAFITVLDIIPRLTQLTKSNGYIRGYEWALVLGAALATVADFFCLVLPTPTIVIVIIGFLAGVFVGTLAAGLTEVLNVFPILAKRLHMETYIVIFLMAMVLGKMLGSLLQWFLLL